MTNSCQASRSVPQSGVASCDESSHVSIVGPKGRRALGGIHYRHDSRCPHSKIVDMASRLQTKKRKKILNSFSPYAMRQRLNSPFSSDLYSPCYAAAALLRMAGCSVRMSVSELIRLQQTGRRAAGRHTPCKALVLQYLRLGW